MKLLIFFSVNGVHVAIVAKTGCSRELFTVTHTPTLPFDDENVTTMSKRTNLFTEYKIINELGCLNYGFEVNKEYQKRLDVLMSKNLGFDEYRIESDKLYEEFEQKYYF